MTTLPSLADFLRGKRTSVEDSFGLFEVDQADTDDAPTAHEVDKLYRRAVDARKRVRLSVPKALQPSTLARMKHFESYGKASCRHICRMICERLPRELRDMIYDNLLLTSARNIPASPACEPIYGSPREHFWRVEYVGKAMIRELLELWYRHTRLHLGLDIGFLERFLSERVDYVDLPRHELVSKISVTLDYRDLLSCVRKQEEFDPTSSPRKRLLERLGYLFQLKEGVSIHIYAYQLNYGGHLIENSPARIAHQEKLLRDITGPIFDSLKRLKDCGSSIAIAATDGQAILWPQDHWLYHLEVGRNVEQEDRYFYPDGDVNMVWRQRKAPS